MRFLPCKSLVSDGKRQDESRAYDVVGELLKNCPALFLGQGTHLCGEGRGERRGDEMVTGEGAEEEVETLGL